MRWVRLLSAAATACSFSGPGGDGDGDGDGDGMICTPGERACDGNTLRRCNAGGDGYVQSDARACPLYCAEGACFAAHNIPTQTQLDCAEAGARLTPPPGATVDIIDNGVPEIQCSPDCGGDQTTIEAAKVVFQAGGPDLVVFCLAALDLGGTDIGTSSFIDEALGFFVTGPVSIEGSIEVDGAVGVLAVHGNGGPGGSDGADGADGMPGFGACAGRPGSRVGTAINVAGGGGGGAGRLGSGGGGGDAVDGTGITAGGGAAVSAACADPALVPLAGGGGGGSGASGADDIFGGRGGGGGGGAIQIASAVSITIAASGSIVARGGDGGGASEGDAGGGGGGAGGSILLEAPLVSIEGALDVSGGDGGDSAGADGGAGATADSLVGIRGEDAVVAGTGGAGGGGGAGHIRINAPGAPACGAVIPNDACTTGGGLGVTP